MPSTPERPTILEVPEDAAVCTLDGTCTPPSSMSDEERGDPSCGGDGDATRASGPDT